MSTLILGLGNPILNDDSAGIRVARFLRTELIRPDVTISEASVAGLDVLNLLTGYDRAIIIDAIQSEAGSAGSIYRLTPEQIAAHYSVSPHDIDFVTALELGKRLGLPLPREIVIFAIEAADISNCGECSREVNAAVPACAGMIIEEIGNKEGCFSGSAASAKHE